MTEWRKQYDNSPVYILVAGINECSMDMRISYYYCNVDENNIVTDIWDAFYG